MKFYNLEFGPYGSESVIGTISEPQYNYWSKNEDRLSEYLNVFDNDNEGIPTNAQIHQDWFEIDDIAHANGPILNDDNNLNFAIIETDMNGVEISSQEYLFNIRNLVKMKVDCIRKSFNDDAELNDKFFFIGHCFEKGVYYLDELINVDTNELMLDKLQFHFNEIEGFKILNKICYEKNEYFITGDTATNASEMSLHKSL